MGPGSAAGRQAPAAGTGGQAYGRASAELAAQGGGIPGMVGPVNAVSGVAGSEPDTGPVAVPVPS